MISSIDIQLRAPRWKTLFRPYCKTVRMACEAALGERGIRGKKSKSEITVVLADDSFIRSLNRDYRGINKPTNVLSFPGEDHLGDLVLALETVEREACEQKKPFKHHAIHLLVHGTLHLLGHDHEKEKEAQKMEKLEVKILKNLGISNPYL